MWHPWVLTNRRRLTVSQASRLLAAGAVTSQELCRYCRDVAAAGEDVWQLHAFAELLSEDYIREQAQASDERRAKNQSRSFLDGIPITIKANIAVETLPLTAGSRILGSALREDTPPVGYNADLVKAIWKRSGAILVGITTLDEFGMGSLGSHQMLASTPQFTRNPLPFLHRLEQKIQPSYAYPTSNNYHSDEAAVKLIQTPGDAITEAHASILENEWILEELSYAAGGSSCGSAASVSHGSSFISLGSDTGGSVRLPAAWCGITGLKPTYGKFSRRGLVAYASSLDTVGILAPTPHCIAMAVNQILEFQKELHEAGHITDSNLTGHAIPFHLEKILSNENSTRTAKASPQRPLKNVRIAIPAAFMVHECPEGVRKAWSHATHVLESQGAIVETVGCDRISPTVLQTSLAAYYVLATAEASSNLARYDGFRYGVAAPLDDPDRNDSKSGNDSWTLLERQYAAARTAGFHPEVIRRILCGTAVLSADKLHTFYEAATKLRAMLVEQLHAVLKPERTGPLETSMASPGTNHDENRYDLLLVPTALFPPVYMGTSDATGKEAKAVVVDPTEMLANDVMTVPISLAGLPAVSVPLRIVLDDNKRQAFFPNSMQLVGPRHSEELLLHVAAVLEQQQQQQP